MKKLAACFLWVLFIAVGCDKTSPVALTADEQLVYDINIIDPYLVENNINAIKDESGVRYLITELGTGAMPTKDNCVTYTYRVSEIYPDPHPYDSSLVGFRTPLKSRVTGMQIALKKIPLGSKAIIIIPSGLAYGLSPDPRIGVSKSAILRYDVEFIDMSGYNALAGYCYE